MSRGETVNKLVEGCRVWAGKSSKRRAKRRFIDAVNNYVEVVVAVKVKDAKDRVGCRKPIYCGNPWGENPKRKVKEDNSASSMTCFSFRIHTCTSAGNPLLPIWVFCWFLCNTITTFCDVNSTQAIQVLTSFPRLQTNVKKNLLWQPCLSPYCCHNSFLGQTEFLPVTERKSV